MQGKCSSTELTFLLRVTKLLLVNQKKQFNKANSFLSFFLNFYLFETEFHVSEAGLELTIEDNDDLKLSNPPGSTS